MNKFQVICLNQNGDSVKVLRVSAENHTAAKRAALAKFKAEGHPAGAATFRLVPLG
jgi:hypothetical protein